MSSGSAVRVGVVRPGPAPASSTAQTTVSSSRRAATCRVSTYRQPVTHRRGPIERVPALRGPGAQPGRSRQRPAGTPARRSPGTTARASPAAARSWPCRRRREPRRGAAATRTWWTGAPRPGSRRSGRPRGTARAGPPASRGRPARTSPRRRAGQDAPAVQLASLHLHRGRREHPGGQLTGPLYAVRGSCARHDASVPRLSPVVLPSVGRRRGLVGQRGVAGMLVIHGIWARTRSACGRRTPRCRPAWTLRRRPVFAGPPAAPVRGQCGSWATRPGCSAKIAGTWPARRPRTNCRSGCRGREPGPGYAPS